jgi:hypothetical protein
MAVALYKSNRRALLDTLSNHVGLDRTVNNWLDTPPEDREIYRRHAQAVLDFLPAAPTRAIAGPYRTTHTYTRYFGEDQVAALMNLWGEIAQDFDGRSPHVDAEVREEMHERLLALKFAIKRMGDRAG